MSTDDKKMGTVYVASMNMRGKWAEAPLGALKLNVTSAQPKLSKNRRDFSPMTHIEGNYKGFWNFESYWQSGKVFEGISRKKVYLWWKKLKEPKRRYPESKNHKVLYAKFDDYPNEKMDYITARKKIYVPEYYKLIKNREMTLYWKQMVDNGIDVVVYDFDGPRHSDGDVKCVKLTKKLLIKKINNLNFSFGHGYIIAGLLADINPDEYLD
jgi:hypothetical protein